MTGTPRPQRQPLDASERRMIELLQQDGRLPVASLARQLGVTEVTARRKLHGLLNSGLVRVVATVDPFDVGLKETYKWYVRNHKPRTSTFDFDDKLLSMSRTGSPASV